MRRFIQSCGFAAAGIRLALRTQRHMRIHVTAALIVTATGMILGIRAMEWALLVLVMGVVICAELLNTAIENVVDLASPDIHPLAKAAKDTASGAVLVAVIAAIIIGFIIFIPHLWNIVL
ncbi:diacylglycerol kinase family protein [Paenibacillus nasutitermitis]|uniref:Undecaprenol kinase n=1 Tax=Paenibacillus nasutitermitis TaxID=1652958 RepID=A0A916Z355_9BACL|nr:diacylglycerol kinase family protein [Paenibacillus nasutitermitis]GGD71383.1 hypothetical protein GCM10010911_31630 [Paenibacillus nasutitermitis]